MELHHFARTIIFVQQTSSNRKVVFTSSTLRQMPTFFHASKHLRWVYALVLLGGLVAIMDTYLPPKRTTSVIDDVSEVSSFESHKGGSGRTRYWSSIDLRNGKNIWTQRTANNFAIGDTMHVDISAVIGKVVRYHSHLSPRRVSSRELPQRSSLVHYPEG